MARNLFLIVDGLALVGVIAFSVLAALHPHTRGYLTGQILCAGLILGSVILLRRQHDR